MTDGTSTSYFRGRKLQSRPLTLPATHRGVVVQREDDAPRVTADIIAEVDEAPAEGTMEVVAEFKELMVWGHESLVDAGEDVYVRGLEEWVGLAAKVSLQIDR